MTITGGGMSVHHCFEAEPPLEPNYTVYVLGPDGKVRRAEWIAAASDADALAAVRALDCASECELWQRNRRVGRVPPSA
jgi:hypothetical protein